MDSVSLVRFAVIACAIWDPRRTETASVAESKLSRIDLQIIKDNIGKNTAVSSFTFRLPLCKLAATAAPETRHEIISVLDIRTLSDTKSCYSSLFPGLTPLLESDLTTLNKIYVNYSDAIHDNFILGAAKFGVTVSKIGFEYPREAVAYVNREFSSKTFMRIRDVLDYNDINAFSSIMLVNGIHYKGTWELPFSSKSSGTKVFRSGDKTITLEMIETTTQCSFLDEKEGQFKAISLHLKQHGTYITFILPYRKINIINILDYMQTTPNLLDIIDGTMEWKFVKIAIPKFKIKTTSDWTSYLTKIGLNLTTNISNKGLNTMLKDGKHTRTNMYVSKAKQKIFVEVEDGVRPSINLRGIIETPLVRPELARDVPESPIGDFEEFIVDGPFYFSIAVIMPPLRGKEKRIYRLISGVYYGPQ